MTSRLMEIQTRFHQKQIQEREDKLMRLYQSQQDKATKIARGSAGSNSSIRSTGSMGGKVRQMFDERRHKEGVDRSYPLQPLKPKRSPINSQVPAGGNDRTSKSVGPKKGRQAENLNVAVYQNGVKYRVTNNNSYDVESYTEKWEKSQNGDAENTIADLMGKTGLCDNFLDDEVMPDLDDGFIDNPVVVGKLANLGGKLPSEIYEKQKPKPSPVSNPVEILEEKRKVKPIVKKTLVRRIVLPDKTNNSNTKLSLGPTRSQAEVPTKPPPAVKTTSSSMSTRQPPQKKAPEPPPSAKAPPGSSRPSAKQPPKTPVVRDDLAPCKFCSRRFASDRLPVHENICAKTAKKKRKVYDATKHRVQGTDLEPYTRKGTSRSTGSSKSTSKQSAKSQDWRRKHEEFIAAIRSAKQAKAHVAKGGKLSDLPPPPPSSNPDYVQCPHCGRKFNEAAAARHIPKCASYEYNKPKPGTGKPPPGSGKPAPGRGGSTR